MNADMLNRGTFSLVNLEFLDTTDRGACCSVFHCRHAPQFVVSKNSKLANENVQNN